MSLITKIFGTYSERELKQFPNLKSIVFNMYHLPPDALISQLEESGIEVGLFA